MHRAIVLTLIAVCPTAFALEPSLDITQYAHTSWHYRDGFVNAAVYAFAQTPDGYLWLATASGVLRFDGVRALPIFLAPGQRLPSTAVWNLLAGDDGTLWIGTFDGLASWKNGVITDYPDLAGYSINAILRDHEGTVWVGALGRGTGRLCAFRNGSATCYGQDGTLGTSVGSLYEAADGSLWVGATTGVWRWKPGPPIRYSSEVVAPGRAFAPGDDPTSVLAAVGDLRQIAGTKLAPYPLHGVPPLAVSTLLRDRNGGLWIGTMSHGLAHSYKGKTSLLGQHDGLSGNEVTAVFEDREGTIWVSTVDGIDRFREQPVISLPPTELSSATPTSILAARDGAIWIGTVDGLNRWDNGHITIYRKRTHPGLPDDSIGPLYEDERGRIWVSGLHGLAAFDQGKFIPAPAVPAGNKHSITTDNHGGLWISLGDGLAHFSNGKIVEQISWREIGGGPGSGLVSDPDGGIWTGMLSGGMAYIRAGQIQRFPLTNPPGNAPRVMNVFRDRDGSTWAATESGAARISNGRVAILNSANGLPCDSVHWMIEDDASQYWLYTRCGLVRIPRTEMDAWVSDPNRTIDVTTFATSDGIWLVPIPKAQRPGVTKSPDGKIWFVNGNSVSVIDPRQLHANPIPPPVHIEQITADQKTYPIKPGMRLPANVRNLRIEFTALSMVAPEKIHFKYKLEGQNRNWHEVINERQAIYTNLAPKNYRFRVMASNNSGVWNETGDTVEFSIAPAYYQTTWFYALCVAVFLAMLWGLYRLRLVQIAREFAVQTAERTRIARELHDTLLQTFQAALIHMQAARGIIAKRPETAVERLDNAITIAAGAIAEGRDAIQGLRERPSHHADLAQLLTAAGEDMTRSGDVSGHPPEFRVIVQGDRQNLEPLLQDEVYRIARELLRNAFQHAQAGRIEAEIRYEKTHLRVHVRDDGKGIDPEILNAGARAGHWGLPGARERVTRFGGQLEFWSQRGAGTEVQLTVPASVAYLASNGGPFPFFRKKQAGS
jgi:signal transduction histidine kinase/ligand-binding sensor domain-containing protein